MSCTARRTSPRPPPTTTTGRPSRRAAIACRSAQAIGRRDCLNIEQHTACGEDGCHLHESPCGGELLDPIACIAEQKRKALGRGTTSADDVNQSLGLGRDILCDAGHPSQPSAVVAYREAGVADQANRAVRPDDAVFVGHGALAAQDPRKRVARGFLVVRVQVPVPGTGSPRSGFQRAGPRPA